jgi:putative spermidine/putrescine transport system permease protein
MIGRTFVALVLLFLALPILVVVLLSVSSATYLHFPPPGLSLRWYQTYFESAEWLESTALSLGVAASVVLLSTVLGTSAALGLARMPARLRMLAGGLILSPLIVPVIVVAIGVYYAYARYGILGQPWALVAAHTCLAVPFVVISVSASLAALDRRLERAALSLGASRWGAFRQITLPLIRPGVLAGALFAFLTSFDELVVALFLSNGRTVTLPRRMWDDIRFAMDPTIAAVSTLVVVITVAMLAGAHWAKARIAE